MKNRAQEAETLSELILLLLQTMEVIYTVPPLHYKQYWIHARHIWKDVYYILLHLLELSYSNSHSKLMLSNLSDRHCFLSIYFQIQGQPILA